MRPRSANLKTVGWLAQWEEMLQDPEQKIARPRQIYLYRLRCAEFGSDRKARANDTHEPESGTRFRKRQLPRKPGGSRQPGATPGCEQSAEHLHQVASAPPSFRLLTSAL